MKFIYASCIAASLLATACTTTLRETPAPVEQRSIFGGAQTPSAVTPEPQKTAPVVASKPASSADWRPASHTVQQGQTLYSIALEYGLDYQELAAWNKLEDINLIKIGQSLRLTPPEGSVVAVDNAAAVTKPAPLVAEPLPSAGNEPIKKTPVAIKLPYSETAQAEVAKRSGEDTAAIVVKPLPPKPAVKPNAVETGKGSAPTPTVTPKPVAPATPPKPAANPSTPPVEAPLSKITPASETATIEGLVWQWPTAGKTIANFAASKGIDIAGTQAQPVYASADGKVVYSGTGLRGYGKLLIIKHNQVYLSAYAHNSAILVKEGETVKRGQKIAEMGDTDTNQIKLHFEIRQYGKPVDPIKYLPTRK